MDPALLTVPDLSMSTGPAESANKCVSWGHKMIYKSTYLDTLGVDESAPLTTRVHHTSTRKFRNDDTRNPIRRYEDIPGAKSIPLPHSRTLSTGLHDTQPFPKNPLMKEQIEGSSPSHWNVPMKPPRISLRVDDIDGATPAITASFGPTHASIKTSRVCDPLCPAYPLPSTPRAEGAVPRFLKDPLSVADIDIGTPTRKLFLTPRQSRLDDSDIAGTSVSNRIKTFCRGSDVTQRQVWMSGYDSLRVEDINDASKRLPWNFKESTRHVDPLQPNYKMASPRKGEGLQVDQHVSNIVEVCEIGQIDGIRVRRFFTGAPFYDTPGGKGDISYREAMLNTSDILGAQCGSKNRFTQRTSPFNRTQYGRTNFIEDIDNAHPSGPFTLLPAWYRNGVTARNHVKSVIDSTQQSATQISEATKPANASQQGPEANGEHHHQKSNAKNSLGLTVNTYFDAATQAQFSPKTAGFNSLDSPSRKSTPNIDRKVRSAQEARTRDAAWTSPHAAASPRQSIRSGVSTPRRQDSESPRVVGREHTTLTSPPISKALLSALNTQ